MTGELVDASRLVERLEFHAEGLPQLGQEREETVAEAVFKHAPDDEVFGLAPGQMLLKGRADLQGGMRHEEGWFRGGRPSLPLGPMQEARHCDRARLGVGFEHAQIPIIGQDGSPLLVIHRKRILRHRVGEVIQRRIDSRYDEKKADDQQGESF